jgi:putative transposase
MPDWRDRRARNGSEDWTRFCQANRLDPSMRLRSNCWDNAVTESFFSSLKKERIRKRIYKTRELARADIFDYIETFCNRTLRHSHPGGVSPEAFELASAWGTGLSTIAWEVQRRARASGNHRFALARSATYVGELARAERHAAIRVAGLRRLGECGVGAAYADVAADHLAPFAEGLRSLNVPKFENLAQKNDTP